MPDLFRKLTSMRFQMVAWTVLLVGMAACSSRNNEPHAHQDAVIDSVAYYTRAIMEDSTNAQNFAQRARLFLANGNLDPALRDLNQALMIQPDQPKYYLALSDVYLVLGQTDNSLAALKKATGLDPNLVPAYLKLAEVYLLIDRPDAAMGAARQALFLDDQNAEAYYMQGISLLQSGDTNNAIVNLQISTRLDEMNFMSYMQLASIAVARGDTMSAMYLREALKDQPQDERALFFLGMILQEQHHNEEALSYFKQVMEYYPKNKRAFYHAGYLSLVELGNPQDAKTFFSQAVDLDSTYVEAVYNLGRTCEELKEYGKARQYYKQSLKLLPNYPLAVQGMNRLDDQGLGL